MVASKHRIASGSGGKVLTVNQAKAKGIKVTQSYVDKYGNKVTKKLALDEDRKPRPGITVVNSISQQAAKSEGFQPTQMQKEKVMSKPGGSKGQVYKRPSDTLTTEEKTTLGNLNKEKRTASKDRLEQINRQIAGLEKRAEGRFRNLMGQDHGEVGGENSPMQYEVNPQTGRKTLRAKKGAVVQRQTPESIQTRRSKSDF